MLDNSQEMRKLIEILNEHTISELDSKLDPLGHVPNKPGLSHIIKKTSEVDANAAINDIDSVISYIDETEKLDPTVRSQILLKAEELVQKLT